MAFQDLLLLAILLHFLAAITGGETSVSRTTYIVQTENNLKPTIFPDVDHWYASTVKTLSPDSPDSSFHHVYRTVFHGFSATLTPSEAQLLLSRPGVISVLTDHPRHLHTTRSPLFLGLVSSNSMPQSLLSSSHFGSSVVIAVLDTGIHPKHRSFRDDGLGPPPQRWKGVCEEGPSFPSTSCNNKLIGARSFSSGFKAAVQANVTADLLSPRDTDGHGTHTASTAAGTPSGHASMLGFAAGVASGVAPKARIAAYKVCWSPGCFDSDILAAMDRAVEDGADIISLSVGGAALPYQLDPISIGAFGAAEKGVLVSGSAGNDGPGDMTVTNVAPWITTVGAGTIDRRFPADVVLGDGTVLTGTSLYSNSTISPPDQEFPLVYAGNASLLEYRSSAPFCMRDSLDPEAVRGKIVLCDRGVNSRAEKGEVVRDAGGAGMILANRPPDGEGLVPDAHLLPAVAVGESEGRTIDAYTRNTTNPRVRFTFHGTQLDVKPAPVLASFSSRGPNPQSAYIIKPDIVGPGVGILAAWPDGVGPTGLAADDRRTEFNIVSGTSMSCPHVSGLAALLKGAHPEWSPAAIRSALMTTAYAEDSMGKEMIDEASGSTRSVGWGMGSGHVDPEKAVDPGLVYELTADDYVRFLCASNYSLPDVRAIVRRRVRCGEVAGKPWDLNYPSVSVVLEQAAGEAKLEVVARRTVTSVGEGPAEYVASVRAPAGATMVVEPERLAFRRKGEKQGFVVRVSAERVLSLLPGSSRTEFGSVTWNDGKHKVRSPVAVTWQQPF